MVDRLSERVSSMVEDRIGGPQLGSLQEFSSEKGTSTQGRGTERLEESRGQTGTPLLIAGG